MQWLNYHHLLYFYVIAKEGGIGKAAKRLNLGQPAISTQLKQLENSLGFNLFDRKNRSLVLTEKGKVIYEYAHEIFRLGGEMIEAVHDRLVDEQVHLQIGAVDSLPKILIHRLVEAAYRLGNCFVTVLEGDGDRLFRELKAHRLDLVLTNASAPLRGDRQVFSRQVAEMPVVVCGAPSFAGLKQNFPLSLQGKPFILPTVHSKLRRDVDHFFETQNIRTQTIGETQDSEVQKLLATSGHALIPIALPAVKDNLKAGTLVKLGTLDHVTEQLWITSASRRIKNPIAAKLMQDFAVV